MNKLKPLAFYLPQYHPIKENNEWWGEGFTEWTNVGKAKPLFPGHKQPFCPTTLGYYDLRVPEVREQQASMAKEYGVFGFIYYHYWFESGKQLLEQIPNEILRTGQPDFPFCFCWANETWTGIWHGLTSEILAEQKYLGTEDIKKHFEYLLPFFQDQRYIRVEDKPLFMIYEPANIPNSKEYLDEYRKLAKAAGLVDLFIVASSKGADSLDYISLGYDANVSNSYHQSFDKQIRNWRDKISEEQNSFINRLLRKLGIKSNNTEVGPIRINAHDVFNNVVYNATNVETYPMVLPNWDNTARSGRRGVVIENTNEHIFRQQLLKAKEFIQGYETKEKFIIIKSWNEWAEGNILEPDLENGYKYLSEIRKIVNEGT